MASSRVYVEVYVFAAGSIPDAPPVPIAEQHAEHLLSQRIHSSDRFGGLHTLHGT